MSAKLSVMLFYYVLMPLYRRVALVDFSIFFIFLSSSIIQFLKKCASVKINNFINISLKKIPRFQFQKKKKEKEKWE